MAEIEEDCLDDPIKFIEFEQRSACFGGCDLNDTEIIDYGYTVENQENYLQDPVVSYPSVCEPLSVMLPNKKLNSIRPVSVKLVDCKKFPNYHCRMLKSTKDVNILEVINLNEESAPNNSEPLSNSKNISINNVPKVSNKKQKKYNITLENSFFVVKHNALKQNGYNKIDFKRNKGLIGLTIKQNIRIEIINKDNVFDTNILKDLGDKRLVDMKKNTSDIVICENVLVNEKIKTNNKWVTKIENKDVINEKVLSANMNDMDNTKTLTKLKPATMSENTVNTREKGITLVTTDPCNYDANKSDSVVSSISVPIASKNEEYSKIKKASIGVSFKKSALKLNSNENRKKNMKIILDKPLTPKKKIEKLLTSPMPKSRKLQLKKQCKEMECETKKVINIIGNKIVTSKPILIGSRVSVPYLKSSDISSVESTVPDNRLKLGHLLVPGPLDNVDGHDSRSLNTEPIKNSKPLNYNTCSTNTYAKSAPKLCFNSKVESLSNSNQYLSTHIKPCPNLSDNMTPESKSDLPLETITKVTNVISHTPADKMSSTNSKNVCITSSEYMNVIPSNTVSSKPNDAILHKPLKSPRASTLPYTRIQSTSDLLTDIKNYLISNPSDTVKVTNDLSNKPCDKLGSNPLNKLPSTCRVTTTNDMQLGTCNEMHLELSDSKTTDNVSSRSDHTSTMCKDNLIYEVSHHSNNPSNNSSNNLQPNPSVPDDFMHNTLDSCNTTKNVESNSSSIVEHHELVDLVINLDENKEKEDKPKHNQNNNVPQNNQNKIAPQNNQNNIVLKNNQNNNIPQNNQNNNVPQNNQNNNVPQNNQNNNVPQNNQNPQNNPNNIVPKNTLPKPFPRHETVLKTAGQTPCSLNTPPKRPNEYILRIRNPVTLAKLKRVDNVANGMNQCQHNSSNWQNSWFDNQRSIFQETIASRQSNCTIPPFQHQPQNNINFCNYSEVPYVNPSMTLYNDINMNWPQPNYFDNNSRFSNYDPNHDVIHSNNSIIGANPGGFVKKINLCSSYSSTAKPTESDQKVAQTSKDMPRNKIYSPAILPIPTYENILSHVRLNNAPNNSGRKRKQATKVSLDKKCPGGKRNKQKITIDDYKKRART